MTQPPKSVAVFGATGTAGRAAAVAIRDAGHDVCAVGRRGARIDGVQDVALPRFDPAALAEALRGTDAVVSCIASRSGAPKDAWHVDHDANLALLKAAQTAEVSQFILLSAICVQRPRLAFQQAKLAFEQALKTSGLTYSIVRPTAFFKSLSGQFNRVKAGRPYLMFGDGALTACKPISDADLGRFIASCLTDPTRSNAVLPIGGPGPALTPRQMGEMLFDTLGMVPKFRRVPPALISTIAGGLSIAGTLSPRLATKAALARIGHYYATESMLVWDETAQRYDADATPEFGSDRLLDHYKALANGTVQTDLGEHAVF